jgi:SulP family sulfate permease
MAGLGGSRVQVGGPTGAFVVVIFNVIAQHGYDGLLLATLMAGVILIVAGYAQLGKLIRFVPHPVVTGFTAGIAVIIASSQVKDFLGLPLAKVPAEFVPKWVAYFGAMDRLSLATLLIGLGSLGVIVGLKKAAPRWPGYLIAVVAASMAVGLFHLRADTIGSRFPDIPSGLPMPGLPPFTLEKFRAVIPSAFTIAFLAGIEALLSAVVADGMAGTRHRSNQELVGQGIANIGSALFGGLPATGAIARTATNIKSGARSPISAMFHAAFLLLFVLFATGLMAYVPMATLAAILFMVALGMSEYRRFFALLRLPGGDRVVLLLTFALTVMVDLTVAIGVGVTLASLLFMKRMSEAVQVEGSAEIEAAPDLDDDLDQRAALPPGVEVFRIAGPFFFGVAHELLETLRKLGQRPRVVILRMRRVPFLDASGAAALDQFVKQAAAGGTRVIFSGAPPQALEVLARSGLGQGSDRVEHAPNYSAALALAARETAQAG